MLQHGSTCIHHIDDVNQISCIDIMNDIVVAGRLNGNISFYHIVSNSYRLKLEEFDRLGLADGFSLLMDTSHKATITCIRISPCMKYIATGTIKGKVMIIDISKSCINDGKISFRVVYSHELHNGLPVSALTWSVTSNKLFSGCNGGLVIEVKCLDIPNFLSSNPLSQPLSFDFSSIFRKKVTSIIYKAISPIRQIECSISETKDLVEYVDLIVISTGTQTLLFQLPNNEKYKSKFRDISYDDSDNNMNVSLTCCCFSNSIDRTSDVPIRANSIYVVRQNNTGNILLHYYTINGDIQETFILKGVDNNDRSNMNIGRINFRFLSNFNSSLYKHALIALDTEGDLFLINLQLMDIQLLESYKSNVYSSCVYDDILLIMKEDHENPFTIVDLIQCISPNALINTKIFSATLHYSLYNLQTKWRTKRNEQLLQKATFFASETHKKVLDLTIDCSDDDLYNYMHDLNSGINTTRNIDKLRYGSFSYISSFIDNLDYEIIQKLENVHVDKYAWNCPEVVVSDLNEIESVKNHKKLLESISNVDDNLSNNSRLISALITMLSASSEQYDMTKLLSEITKLKFSFDSQCIEYDKLYGKDNDLVVQAEISILISILLFCGLGNNDPISQLPNGSEDNEVAIDIDYLLLEAKDLCESTYHLLDSQYGNSFSHNNYIHLAAGKVDNMDSAIIENGCKSNIYENGSPKGKCPTSVADEFEDSSDVSWLKESGDWRDTWRNCQDDNPNLLIKNRIATKRASRVETNVGNSLTERFNSLPLESLENIHGSDPNKETFEVTLEAPYGIGLSLVLSFDRTLEVKNFIKDMRGNQSPAEACGLIKIGDFLIGVNGLKFSNMKLEEIAELLKKLDKLEEKSIRLTFRYGDTSCMTTTSSNDDTLLRNENPLLNLDGMDITLNSRFSDHAAFSPTIDDQINCTWVDSKTNLIEPDNFPILNQLNQLSFEQLNDLTFEEWLAQTLRASQALGLGYNSKELELPSQSVAPPISTEMIQTTIMAKHLYPIAAPIACFGHQSDHISQVREIANLAWEWRHLHIAANHPFYFCSDRFSRLIQTPFDKGIYKQCFPLVWDESRLEYVIPRQDEVNIYDVEVMEKFAENNKKMTRLYPVNPSGININNLKNGISEINVIDTSNGNKYEHNYLEKQGFIRALDEYDEDHPEIVNQRLYNYIDNDVINDNEPMLDCSMVNSKYHAKWIFNCIDTSDFRDIMMSGNIHGMPNKLQDELCTILDDDIADKELLKAISFEIDNVRYGKEYCNLHPEQLAMRIQLPPVNLTVSLLQTISCYLQHSLNCDRRITILLNKWMQTFCPISVHKRTRFRSKYMNFLDAANYGFSSGVELRDFIAIMTDLVTLTFLLNTCWMYITNDDEGQRSIKVSTDKNKESYREIEVCNFNFLKLKLVLDPFEELQICNDDNDVLKKYWNDSEATEFIEKYGAYLDIDIVSAACSAVQFRSGLDYVLSVALTDENLAKASSAFNYVIKTENLYTSQQFLSRVFESTAPDFNLALSLLLNHLGVVYQKDEDIAIELSILFFPYIRPWNVKRALFGDTDIEIIPIINKQAVDVSSHSNDDSNDHCIVIKLWQENARKKYHRYLTELLIKFQKDICADISNSSIFEEFVDLSFYLSQYDAKNNSGNDEIRGFKQQHKDVSLMQLLHKLHNTNNNFKGPITDSNFYIGCIKFIWLNYFTQMNEIKSFCFIEKCKQLNVI